MHALIATLARELKIVARHRSEWLMPLIFFALVVSLFALGTRPKDPALAAFAPAVIWVGALLSALLTSERLFRADFEDGSLEQMFLAPQAPSWIVAGKLAAHWLFSGLPLVLLGVPLALALGVSPSVLPSLSIGLLLGTPVLSLIGGFASALTVALPRVGLLLPVLVLPMLVPIVIFGAGAVRAAQAGLDASGPIYFLAAALALSVTLLPWATTAALRNAFD